MDNAFMSSFYFRNAVEGAEFEKSAQWNALLDLTHAVWRVADITVENEMLKNRLKQGAMEILTDYPNAVSGSAKAGDVLEKIRSQCALLSLAQKTVHGSREMNFFILKNEYYKISTMLSQYVAAIPAAPVVPPPAVRHHRHHEDRHEQKHPVVGEEKEKPVVVVQERKEEIVAPAPVIVKKPVVTSALNDRQKKILQFFNKRKGENIRLKEIAQFFPDLTDRTVRNDLRDLCLKKMISRSEGHGQASFYRLAKNGIDESAGGATE